MVVKSFMYVVLLCSLSVPPAHSQGFRFDVQGPRRVNGVGDSNVLAIGPNALPACSNFRLSAQCTNQTIRYTRGTSATTCAMECQIILTDVRWCLPFVNAKEIWGAWDAPVRHSYMYSPSNGLHLSPNNLTMGMGDVTNLSFEIKANGLPRAIARTSRTAPNTLNETRTFGNNNTSVAQSNLTNSCSIDGLIWVSQAGCYTTIAAALEALGGAAGTIIIPPGTWATPVTIALTKSGQHIQCAGIGSSIVSYTGGPTTAIFDVGTSPDSGLVNISINGCTITGNANVQYAIRTRGVHHSDFSHNSLINVTTAGIRTNFGVVLLLDDLHTSFNEQSFTVQPQSCIILDGPDTSHKTTTGTIKTPVCEGVSGTGIILNNTADIRIINGTSEQNNKGLTISPNSQNATVDGTDFEQNVIADIENSGNQTRLTMLSSLGLTRITGSAIYARLDGGLYNSITIDPGAVDTHLEKLSYNNYGDGALTDSGTRTSKFRIVNLSGGGAYDPDVIPENLSLAGITNSTGIQAFNTTTSCTTAAQTGATCTTAPIALPVSYTDTNYRLACTGLSPTNVPAVQTITKSNATFTITIVAIRAAAATYGSYDCMAIHN